MVVNSLIHLGAGLKHGSDEFQVYFVKTKILYYSSVLVNHP